MHKVSAVIHAPSPVSILKMTQVWNIKLGFMLKKKWAMKYSMFGDLENAKMAYIICYLLRSLSSCKISFLHFRAKTILGLFWGLLFDLDMIFSFCLNWLYPQVIYIL